MKKIIYFFFTFCSVFYSSQSNCNYINIPANAWYPNEVKDPSIFAIDFNIPAQTIVSLQSAEFDVRFRSHGNINQATVYLYEDNNGQPGVLISSHPLTVTSTLIDYTQTLEWCKVIIPLQTLAPITPSNVSRKMWFGFKLTIPNWSGTIVDSKKMCVSSGLMTDGTPVKYFNTSTNLWEEITGATDKDAKISIISNCSSFLSTNEIARLDFEIYPNPVIDFLMLNRKKINKVELFDYSGKYISTKKLMSDRLDLSNIPSGDYIIKIYESNGKILTKKIIKK